MFDALVCLRPRGCHCCVLIVFLLMCDLFEVVVGRLGGNRYQGATLFKGRIPAKFMSWPRRGYTKILYLSNATLKQVQGDENDAIFLTSKRSYLGSRRNPNVIFPDPVGGRTKERPQRFLKPLRSITLRMFDTLWGRIYFVCNVYFLPMCDLSEVVVRRLGGNCYQGTTLFKDRIPAKFMSWPRRGHTKILYLSNATLKQVQSDENDAIFLTSKRSHLGSRRNPNVIFPDPLGGRTKERPQRF